MCVCWRWGEWRTYRYRNSGSTGANEEQCSPAGETEEKAKRKKDIYMYSMYRERERERCSDLWLCRGSVNPQLLHISMRHQQRCSAANPLINLTPDTHTHTHTRHTRHTRHTHQPRESQLIPHMLLHTQRSRSHVSNPGYANGVTSNIRSHQANKSLQKKKCLHTLVSESNSKEKLNKVGKQINSIWLPRQPAEPEEIGWFYPKKMLLQLQLSQSKKITLILNY